MPDLETGLGERVLPPANHSSSIPLPPAKLTPSDQTMLSTILGFSAFGFATRVGQLAIQKRPLFTSESSHGSLM